MRADEGRQLRVEFEGQPGRVGAEPRECPEAPTPAWSTEADELDASTGDAEDLLERICSWDNMSEACARVVRNGGAGGMAVSELTDWLDADHEALAGGILSGRYRPKPVRRVEMPKGEGARSGCSAYPRSATGWSSRRWPSG